jgi:hypothetical protein
MPDGGVLFAQSTEVYFGLNVTGAFVWEHLSPVCATVDDVAAALVERFPEVALAEALQDVTDLVAEFSANNLVVAS